MKVKWIRWVGGYVKVCVAKPDPKIRRLHAEPEASAGLACDIQNMGNGF
jgi:hypothetical protein